MESITITRALAELKLLDSRIKKKITESEFVFFLSKKNKSNINQETLVNNSKAQIQSISDLIDRRKNLKSSIVLSNANTMVNLAGETMSVAEVIERKQLVEYYKQLLDRMKFNRESVLNQVERQNQLMEVDLQKILEINFGKNSTAKTNSDDIDNISKTYRELNKAEVLDGVNIDSKIKEIEELINRYETESNFVLSESNAITKINF
jgi:hypothetical protein